MNVTSTGTSAATNKTGTSSTSLATGTQEVDFLKLLITKLSNQNPLDAQSQEEFLGNLAQFESLNQMIKLNKNLEATSLAQQLSGGSNLIGKTIQYENEGFTYTDEVVSVKMVNGECMLSVGNNLISLNQIRGVS